MRSYIERHPGRSTASKETRLGGSASTDGWAWGSVSAVPSAGICMALYVCETVASSVSLNYRVSMECVNHASCEKSFVFALIYRCIG